MLLKGRRDVCHMFLWSQHLFISGFVALVGYMWMLLLCLISQLSTVRTYLIATVGVIRPICTLGILCKMRKAALLCLGPGKAQTHFLYRLFVWKFKYQMFVFAPFPWASSHAGLDGQSGKLQPHRLAKASHQSFKCILLCFSLKYDINEATASLRLKAIH